MMDSVSESDSHTDCSPYATDVEVDGRPFDDALVICRVMDGDGAVGLGTGLGHSWAGMKAAWSKRDTCGSFVTGSMRLGGEIRDGSICPRDPWP